VFPQNHQRTLNDTQFIRLAGQRSRAGLFCLDLATG
jgi:hypothetical protein